MTWCLWLDSTESNRPRRGHSITHLSGTSTTQPWSRWPNPLPSAHPLKFPWFKNQKTDTIWFQSPFPSKFNYCNSNFESFRRCNSTTTLTTEKKVLCTFAPALPLYLQFIDFDFAISYLNRVIEFFNWNFCGLQLWLARRRVIDTFQFVQTYCGLSLITTRVIREWIWLTNGRWVELAKASKRTFVKGRTIHQLKYHWNCQNAHDSVPNLPLLTCEVIIV